MCIRDRHDPTVNAGVPESAPLFPLRKQQENVNMNNEYIASVNSGVFYLIVACVLLFITVMCFVYLIKSYRAGLAIGMDKKVLKRAIISSATFTILPSISILLGVIALSAVSYTHLDVYKRQSLSFVCATWWINILHMDRYLLLASKIG